ncbi:MAG: hypothetical protein AB7R55_12300 [Gemmatimonadales bacterium]
MILSLRRQHGRWALAIALGSLVVLAAGLLLRPPLPIEPDVAALAADGAPR